MPIEEVKLSTQRHPIPMVQSLIIWIEVVLQSTAVLLPCNQYHGHIILTPKHTIASKTQAVLVASVLCKRGVLPTSILNMVHYCCMVGCNSHSKRTTYHRFPLNNKSKLHKWVTIVRRKAGTLTTAPEYAANTLHQVLVQTTISMLSSYMSILTVLPMIHRQTPQPYSHPDYATNDVFPSEYGNTSSSSTGSSKCKRFNCYSSRIHKQETAHSFLLHLPLAFQQSQLQLLLQLKMHLWTQLMSKLIHLNSTTHDQSIITSTPPESIAADTTCISAIPCLVRD